MYRLYEKCQGTEDDVSTEIYACECAEWKTVMKRITDAGKKPSHFLRDLLLYGKVVSARTQEDRQQIRMLEGGCNNLNQLAKMAHQQGFSLLKGKIMDLLDEFNKIIGKI